MTRHSFGDTHCLYVAVWSILFPSEWVQWLQPSSHGCSKLFQNPQGLPFLKLIMCGMWLLTSKQLEKLCINMPG